MKSNKVLLNFVFFFLLIFSSISVLAQPPFQSSEDIAGDLTIIFPKRLAYEVNSELKLHFHIHNSSGYLLSPNKTDCFIHSYDKYGNHILQEDLLDDSNNIEKYIIINSSLTTTDTEFPYTIYCNSTEGEAGYVSGQAILTNSGEFDEFGAGQKWLTISLLLIIMSGLFLSISAMIRDEGLKPFKMLFFVMGVLNSFMLGILAYIISLNPHDITAYRPLGLGYATINVLLIFGFVWNYILARTGAVYKNSTSSARYGKRK